MSGTTPKIGVVILNYCGWRYTVACAESVLSGSVAPDWLIIVDNASPDESLGRIREWGKTCCVSGVQDAVASRLPAFMEAGEGDSIPCKPTVLLLRRRSNGGYSAGNNAAIRLLLRWGADAVWILNNDVVVDKDALMAMRERLFSSKRPGLCGSLVCYMDEPERVQCRGGGKTNWWTMLSRLNGKNLSLNEARAVSEEEVERDINFIYGASVMASRNFLENVGLLNEKLFLYCEEQDWALRAQGKFDFAYAPNALVWHREGASTGHSEKSKAPASLARLSYNRLRLAMVHNPCVLPIVVLALVFAAIRMIYKRIFDTSLAM